MYLFQYKSVFLLFLGVALPAFSANLDCSAVPGTWGVSRTSVGGNYTISNINITTPINNKKLYSVTNSALGHSVINVNCTGGNYKWYYTLMDTNFTDSGTPTAGTDADPIIYSTTKSGIGLSVNAARGISNSIKIWPDVLDIQRTGPTNQQVDTWVSIRLWKTGETAYGPFTITGPTIVEFIRPANIADKIETCPVGATRFPGNDRDCIVLTRTLTISGNVISGTCPMATPHKTVQMGKHNSLTSQNSRWVDASFALNCPQAWGYNTIINDSRTPYNDSDTSSFTSRAITQNKSVRIQITPYNGTTINNSANGILNTLGDAKGYGIQLAWGAPDTQTEPPAKPVALSAYTDISSLNSSFPAGPYVIGGYAIPISSNGIIKMAARYVRTTGEIRAGKANAIVEVIASYE